MLVALSLQACALHDRPSPENPANDRLHSPSMGLSIPQPPGWILDPQRVGSIGSFVIATWYKPEAPGSHKAVAYIALVGINPSIRKDFVRRMQLEPGPRIDGKPSLRMISDGKVHGVGYPFLEGYDVQAHDIDFFLLFMTNDPTQNKDAFEAVASGISWSEPTPAHQALTSRGWRTVLGRDSSLSFELPDPFWANGFRGEYYEASSLAAHDNNKSGSAHIEVDELEGAGTTDAALAAAAQKQTYYGTRDLEPTWRPISENPEVKLSELHIAPEHDGVTTGIAMIVVRSPKGRYFRVALVANGPAGVVAAYKDVPKALARSISANGIPPVPEFGSTSP